MIPAAAMQSRRRSRLPARATSHSESTRCPRARDRSNASSAQHTVRTAHAGHSHTGVHQYSATIAISSIAGSVSARVQRLRVATAP